MITDENLKRTGLFELFHTCQIHCKLKNSDKYDQCVGFFYNINNVIYAVTNQHCIYGKNFMNKVERKYDSLNIVYKTYKKVENELEYNTLNHPIDINNDNGIIYKKNHDVCIIKTNIDKNTVEYISKKNIITDHNLILQYQKILSTVKAHDLTLSNVNYYPKIYMYTHYFKAKHNTDMQMIDNDEKNINFPFLKKGNLIQNIFDIFESDIIYGDIKSISGNSGSPVFLVLPGIEQKYGVKMERLLFLGINSGEDMKITQHIKSEPCEIIIKERLGMNRIVNPKYLLELDNLVNGISTENLNITNKEEKYNLNDEIDKLDDFH
jgi:hypothetical protein